MSINTFHAYSIGVSRFAEYPDHGDNLVYPALGLAGEAGEFAEKVKKLWRNHGQMSGRKVTPEQRREMLKELGDVIWYVNACANELDSSLAEVAEMNLEKLTDRAKRGVIKAEGDNR